jgi:drug/metabolite transporter (DMT)-like permease
MALVRAYERKRMENRNVWGAFLLLALAWGTSFMFIKVASRTVAPLTLVTVRLLFAWPLLLLIARWRRLPLPRRRDTWRHLAVIGVINVAVPFSLITWAESGARGLDSGLASVLNSTVPLFSVIIAGLLWQMEQVTTSMVAGLLVGFGGVVVLFGGTATWSVNSLLPYVAVVLAAVAYALGTAYARRNLHGVPPVILATGQLFTANVTVAVGALLFDDLGAQRFPLESLGALAWLGIIGSCLAYILYFYILREWGATRATLVTYVIPVVAVTVGFLFLDERVGWRLLVGGLLVLCGVAVVNWRPPRLRSRARR